MKNYLPLIALLLLMPLYVLAQKIGFENGSEGDSGQWFQLSALVAN